MAAVKKASKAAWKGMKDPAGELSELAGKLNHDELRILVRIARRLHVGLERYGAMRLLKDKRNYKREAAEELLDWLVYTEMDLERKAQRAARRATAPTRKSRSARRAGRSLEASP